MKLKNKHFTKILFLIAFAFSFVTYGMPISIIDGFELIDIHHQQGNRYSQIFRGINCKLQCILQLTPGKAPGQRIYLRLVPFLLNLVLQLRLFLIQLPSVISSFKGHAPFNSS